MKAYYLIQDCGDGSSSITWFKDAEIAEQRIIDDPEQFGMNDWVGDLDVTDEQYAKLSFWDPEEDGDDIYQ